LIRCGRTFSGWPRLFVRVNVGQNVHEAPERVTDKEAAHAPRFDDWAVLNVEAAFLELAASDV
jgi:hypothetical protein